MGGKPSAVASKAYDNLSGQTNPDNMRAAKFNEGLRNLTSAAKLPMAVLSAPPDAVTNIMAATYNGIGGFRNMLGMVSSLFTARTPAARQLAADLHMQMDFLVDSAHAAGRYFDVGGHGITAKLAGFTLKGGGLNHWTIANKMAFHFSFMRELGSHNNMDSIVKKTQLMKSFERYGIDKDMVKKIVNSTKMKRRGKTFFDPSSVDDDVAEAVGAMIAAETKLAVPEADVRVKSFLNQGTKRGTAGGEALRFMTMFKTFPTSILLNNWARILHGSGRSTAGRVGMAANLFIGTTALGMLSLQLKAIAREPVDYYDKAKDGKLPYDLNSKQLWFDAFKQGGGVSVLSDIFSEDAQKYGSLADYLGGPAIGVLNDVFFRGMIGGTQDVLTAEKTAMEYAKDIVAGATKYVPGQFFYTKAIWNRIVAEEAKRMADPRYDLKRMRREQKRDKEYNEKIFKRW